MNPLLHTLNRLNVVIGHSIRWLGLLMVLITVVIVLLRYLFNVGAIGLQESVMYLHGILFLLGIPYALQQGAHVRVDIVYSRLSPTWQNRVDLCGHCLFLIPISLFILYTSLPYVGASWRVLEGSGEVGGIPAIFALKTLIPVMAVLLLCQGIVEIGRILAGDVGSGSKVQT